MENQDAKDIARAVLGKYVGCNMTDRALQNAFSTDFTRTLEILFQRGVTIQDPYMGMLIGCAFEPDRYRPVLVYAKAARPS